MSWSDGNGDPVSATARASFAYCISSVITDQSRIRPENQTARNAAAAHQSRNSPAAAANRGERSGPVTGRSLARSGATPSGSRFEDFLAGRDPVLARALQAPRAPN